MWSDVDFGKWREKGKSLPQVVVADPDWFFWAVEDDKFHGSLAIEARRLARRAQSIKIPSSFGDGHCIQYMLTPDGRFAHFNIIPSDQGAHLGSSSEIRRSHLSLRMARQINEYDKLGGRQLIDGFRHHWFADKPLTRRRVEDFFDASLNFADH